MFGIARGARRGLVAAAAVAIAVASCGGQPPTPSHFAASGISFDYPAAWATTQLNVPRHYETVLGLLGNGQFAEACPSDALAIENSNCTEQLSFAPDTVVVKVSTWQLPTPAGMSQVQYQQSADPSAVPMTVAGQRAVRSRLGEPMDGADQHWLWLVDAPGSSWTAYGIEAWLRGPNTEALRAQVDALVASIALSTTAP